MKQEDVAEIQEALIKGAEREVKARSAVVWTLFLGGLIGWYLWTHRGRWWKESSTDSTIVSPAERRRQLAEAAAARLSAEAKIPAAVTAKGSSKSSQKPAAVIARSSIVKDEPEIKTSRSSNLIQQSKPSEDKNDPKEKNNTTKKPLEPNRETTTTTKATPTKTIPDTVQQGQEESTPSKLKKTKKKKRQTHLPQLLCEVFSRTFQMEITMEGVKNATKTTNQIMLPPSDDAQAFAKNFTESEMLTQVSVKDMKHALHIYNSAENAVRNGYPPRLLSKKDDGFEELVDLSQQIQNWIVNHILIWLSNHKNNDHAAARYRGDNTEPDLFSDDYDTSVIVSTTPTATTDPRSLEHLVAILIHQPSLVSPTFLVRLNNYNIRHKILQQLFVKLRDILSCSSSSSSISNPQEVFTQTLSAVQFVLATTAKFLPDMLIIETTNNTGRTFESSLSYASIFCAVAYTLDDSALFAAPAKRLLPSVFLQELEDLDTFPGCAVVASNAKSPLQQLLRTGRKTMKYALTVSERFLKVALKKDTKHNMFQFVRTVIDINQQLISMPKSDFATLDPDSVLGKASSPAFALGLSYTFLSFCSASLQNKFREQGHVVFDPSYICTLGFHDGVDTPLLFNQVQKMPPKKEHHNDFTGSTELFFLTSALLRVSLQTLLKRQIEFRNVHRKLFDDLRRRPDHYKNLNARTLKYEVNPKVALLVGFATFLDEPDFIVQVTEFYLLQLEWLLSICKDGSTTSTGMRLLPDWFCKDAARWLGHVAQVSPHILTPSHADRAIDCCAQLLRIGISETTSFSPIVVTSLVRIASNFVNASVNRAKRRQPQSQHVEDSRDIDIYSSFDQKDLGVAVFTNRQVCTTLCPTLVRTFCTLDMVEGLDMDREFDFDKFSVKTEIADLLMRLWNHPNGECRASVASMDGATYVTFVMSATSALAVFLDDAIQKLGTVFKVLRQQTISDSDQKFVDGHLNNLSGGLLGSRRLLMVMCSFSHEERLSSFVGGQDGGDSKSLTAICTIFVHFFDILTGADGGTNADLELDLSERTSSLIPQFGSLDAEKQKQIQEKLHDARSLAIFDAGIDVSVVCHQLLALLSKWHHASCLKSTGRQDGVSPIIDVLCNIEDTDVTRYRHILRRLVRIPASQSVDDSIMHDGYTFHRYSRDPSRSFDGSDSRRQRAKHEQMPHQEVRNLATDGEIEGFLEALSTQMGKSTAHVKDVIGEKETGRLEALILDSAVAPEASYQDILDDWIVSASPFSRQRDGRFLHYYDSSARSKSTTVSAKILIGEAKKCNKTIPTPHANSSIFVCFAEERMDLCRAAITGPVDTPYAMGLFLFDIFFPSAYPNVPPLVTYMTTGGGQIRFSPNLYVDGKVCLSLLGLTYTSKEYERWTPNDSSIAQVLLSIQSQIFDVKEPYFNEGSGIPDFVRQTDAGKEGSLKHNISLRLATLRYAIVAPMQNPPVGYETVVLKHFSLCRKRILVQTHRWMLEAKESSLYPKYVRVYSKLLTLLADEKFQSTEALSPLKDDVEIVTRLDPEFARLHDVNMDTPEEKIPTEAPSEAANLQTQQGDQEAQTIIPNINDATNPWAAASAASQLTHASTDTAANDDDDDDADDDMYS